MYLQGVPKGARQTLISSFEMVNFKYTLCTYQQLFFLAFLSLATYYKNVLINILTKNTNLLGLSEISSSIIASLLGRLSSSGFKPIFTAEKIKKSQQEKRANFLREKQNTEHVLCSSSLTLAVYYFWPIFFIGILNI